MADDSKPNLRAKHVKQLTKTEMCKFFLLNRCGKGSRCPFAHSRTEIREKPNLNCTSMCRSFLQSGNCDNPTCAFAHCERDLKTTGSFFKSKMCRFAASGRCKHGEACRFAHAATELSQEVSVMQPAGGNDTMFAVDAAATSSFGSYNSEPYSGGAHGENKRGRKACGPQAQREMSTTNLGEVPSDQSSSNEGNDPRRNPRSDHSAWIDDVSSTRANTARKQVTSGQSVRSETRDQTKADIDRSASAMTPWSSEDSAQEEYDLTPLPLKNQRGEDRARRLARCNAPPTQRAPRRHCTTVMLTNVPQFLTQGSLLSLLEDMSSCMRGSFDFFFCPWNPFDDRNLGYAIINFFSRSVAAEFELQWTNQLLLPRAPGMKRLRVVPAALQGRAANLRHFSGVDLANHTDPRFRPLVRSGPHEVLRPMALARELSQGSQNRSINNQNGNQAVTFRDIWQENQNSRYAQRDFRDKLPGELEEQFQLVIPQLQQQAGIGWSEQHGIEMPPHAFAVFEAAEFRMGSGIQCGGYENDFDMGSGAETPELENEHPLSRQASAQAPTALMAMLATLRNQHETQARGQEDEAGCQGPFVQGAVAKSTLQHGRAGFEAPGHGGDVSSAYDGSWEERNGGAASDFPFIVLQPGAITDDAPQCRIGNGGTDVLNEIPPPPQPYWALVVPPGAAVP